MNNVHFRKYGAVFAVLLVLVSLLAVVPAEARRGGSFGSRGMRTFTPPPVTRVAPNPTAPINRSMTPDAGPTATPGLNRGAQAAQAGNRGGFMSGLGGGLLGGLLGGLFFSGLFGSLFGAGFGGLGGAFSMIFQVLLVGGLIWLAMRFFRRQPATANGAGAASPFEALRRDPAAQPAPAAHSMFGGGNSAPASAAAAAGIEVGNTDLESFERLLHDVQAAFSREDHQALRRLTTPEMVSYLSEELADNAKEGLRNDVTDLKFLEGDVAEAWNEGSTDYATVAMQWTAIDVMRDRQTGEVKRGDANEPVETREFWTFVRHNGGAWQLSAIQEAGV